MIPPQMIPRLEAESPPMQLRLRNADRHDIASILVVERLCFSQPWSAESFDRELTLPFSRIILAEHPQAEAARLAGFLCRWLVADECHILNVAVHPQYRRVGVGLRLMRTAIDEAITQKLAAITLEVRRSNLAARALYRKLEFEERRVRRNYYGAGEDAILMERSLA